MSSSRPSLGIADASQAIKIVRQRASEWRLNPNRIGFMGISMGGFIVSGVVMNLEPRSRPDFFAAVYGGETGGRPVPSNAPPLFAVVAQDDAMMAGKVLNLYSAWNGAKGSAELHVFSKGGHGFGTIKQGLPVDGWLGLFGDWLRFQNSTRYHIGY